MIEQMAIDELATAGPLHRIRQALAGRSMAQIIKASGKTLAKSIRSLTPAARAAAHADQAFDRRWQTDTSREVGMNALDFPVALKNGSHHYQASGPHVLDLVVAASGIDPSAFTFIDYGSGKGRMVLLAAAKPFHRAIGVEYAALLDEIARKNAANFMALGGASTTPEFWQGNASDFPPPDGNLFCYVYNAFGPEILAGCVDRLETAKRLMPDRTILIAYVNPQHAAVLSTRPAWREQAGADDVRIFVCEADNTNLH